MIRVGNIFYYIKNKLEISHETQGKRPQRFKRRVKKIKPEKLKKRILEYIVSTDKSSICKEELTRLFQLEEHRVEQVFHVLNLEGVLSQRTPDYTHDTNRNPIFYGMKSGWASDLYHVLDREKAKKLLSELH